MPGPTNPWASELKKTRQRGGGNKPLLKGKEQKSSSLQHPDDAIKHQDETSRDEKSQDEKSQDEKSLHETREAVITTTTNTMEKAAVDEVKKYVKVQDDDDDNAAAEVLRVANSTKKKESSSPPYSKVNNDDVIPTPKSLKKKVRDTNQNKQQVSKSTSSVVVDDDSSSKKKVSPKVNETTITDAELPLKVRKKTVDANLPKEVSSGGTATKKVKSTLPDTDAVASKVNDTSVSPKGPKDSLAAVQLKKKSNDAAKPSSLNTNRCLYQDARSQLKPVASILSRQLSQEAKIDVVKVAAPDNDDETPVDRLIKQGSIEQPKEEAWGEDDEWEWESEEGEDQKGHENSEVKMPQQLQLATNGLTNNSNGTANGATDAKTTTNWHSNLQNGTANGHHINEEDNVIEEVNGKADIKIQGNLLKIERTGPVEWSDDEYEEEEVEEEYEQEDHKKIEVAPASAPPPPPPPPMPPAPPPPPPMPSGSEIDAARARKLEKLDKIKKRPEKRPDWNELMREIDSFRFGSSSQKLKKVACNDRSKPMLTKTKIQGKFIYDSEQKAAEHDIFDDIKKGVRLKKVKTNDRSKPMLTGIRAFRRQLTKEERFKSSISMEEPNFDDDDAEDMVKLRDDLESTKQLLELEVRSKKLLEKDNKRLAQELEKLKYEMTNKSATMANVNGNTNADFNEENNNSATANDEISSGTNRNSRKNSSVTAKRHSVIRLLSESENKDTEQEINSILNGVGGSATTTNDKEELDEVDESTEHDLNFDDEIAEIDEMREEVDEARKLAEEWETKYKDMQRQMSELESSRHKKHSIVLESAGFDFSSSIQYPVASEYEENDDDGDYAWMLKREIHTLNHKLRNIKDKREIVVRERQLLQERIDTLIGSIGNELDGRKRLKKEINEMNEAFKDEIYEMEAEQKLNDEMEEYYFSDDEELVPNVHKRKTSEEDLDEDSNDLDDDDQFETVDDLINLAEEDETDPGAEFFESYPEEEDDEEVDENQLDEEDYEPTRESLTQRVEHHNENVHLMRKSNFMLKAKIDRLYDVLQMQKEKHHDLRQELTRMLADIQ